MITITIHNLGNFPVNEEQVKTALTKTLTDNGVEGDTETSVAIVSKEKMQWYVDTYYGADGEDHPVLSFPTSEVEGEFAMPPDDTHHLGEIIVSYDYCKEEAKKTGGDIDDIICDMASHGALHLLGIHHD